MRFLKKAVSKMGTLTRWKCEECDRYIKQSYNMEDLRVRGYNAIRNIVVLVNAIAYFFSVHM